MNKHTPGPWLSRGKSDSVHESSDTHPYGCQIFRFADDQGPSDDDLNLILSAPDLLEALEGMLEIYGVREQHMSREPFASSTEVDCCNQARAAIARARGAE